MLGNRLAAAPERTQGRPEEAIDNQSDGPPSARWRIFLTVQAISTLRALAAMVFVGFALTGDGAFSSFALYAFCILSDIADGWLARRFRVATETGRVVDFTADKCLTIGCVVVALSRGVWAPPLLIILLREILSGCLKAFRSEGELVFHSIKSIGRYIFGGLFGTTGLLLLTPDPFPLPGRFFDVAYSLVCAGLLGLALLQAYRARNTIRRMVARELASN